MDKYSRRSVLRGSLGVAAAAALSKPHIANAAATTATVWVNQGFVKAEDEAFKQLAADYMKASGNKLDYSIMPFMALNQKTISALTSGDVPDLVFMDAPSVDPAAERLGRQAGRCQRRRGALRSRSFRRPRSSARPSTTRRRRSRSYYLCPIKQGCHAVPHLGRPGREGRPQDVGCAKDLGRVLGFLQAGAEGAARQGHAQDLRAWPADHHGRTERRQQPVHALPDRQWRRGHRHAGRQAAHRRSEGARGGDQVGRVHDQRSTRKATCRRRR